VGGPDGPSDWNDALPCARFRRQIADLEPLALAYEAGVKPLWDKPGLGHQLACAVPLLLLISLVYTFLGSSGTWREVPGRTDYYDRMAEGFRSGHLYILEAPAPQLLAQKDPYLDRFVQLGVWDASLYDGHYYLYWGPVPALLLLAFKVITRHAETVTDQWLVLLFILGRLIAGTLVLLELSRLRRPPPPAWLLGLAIAVFGLAGPTPFTVTSPNVWEACLLSGQCFLLGGLWLALRGLLSAERRLPLFLLAGALWALAVGSRVTLILVVPSFVLLTVLLLGGRAWREARSWPRVLSETLRPGLALGLPVLAAIGGYASYNYARFGSVTDFGVDYQISYQWFWTHEAFLLPNVFSYLWGPLRWSCRFPFVFSVMHRPLSPLIHWPPGYQTWERVAGVLVMAPWCYLLLLWLWRSASFAWRGTRPVGLPRAPGSSWPELWAIACSLAMLPAMVPALSLWEASMRYSGDALSGALIASSLAAFSLHARARASLSASRRTLAPLLLAALGAYTCLVGAFSGVVSYDDVFLFNNPALIHRLQAKLSFCAGAP
jgi:hypothetical protein